MLDIQQLRSNLDTVAAGLAKRGKPIDFSEFTALEAERKTLQTRTQELQAQRNSLSRQIGMLKGQGKDASDVMAQVGALGDELKASEGRLGELLEKFNAILAGLPNIPDESVPVGDDENANVEIKRWGSPRVFDFPVRDHTDIGETLGQLDFATAAKISGSRFSLLKGGLARLHRALAQFMLDTHTAEHGYTELYAPYLVNAASLHGTGQLPKFEEDLFKVLRGEQDPLYLIPTAEVPVTNIVRDEILAGEALPLKFVCHTPCFRSEAGSGGRDVRGMIRQHQFDKVELVQIVHPEQFDRGARGIDPSRRGHPRTTGVALPPHGAVLWRHGFLCRQDLRSRSLAAGTEHLPRDFLLLQLRRLPGAPHAGPFPQRQEQAGAGAHAERFRAGRRPHAGGDSGKQPAGRWQRYRAGSTAPLHGRAGEAGPCGFFAQRLRFAPGSLPCMPFIGATRGASCAWAGWLRTRMS